MNVTREVIVDLLPLYVSGEASPASRALVEEFLTRDPELAERVRHSATIDKRLPSTLPPELELRTLHRTRGLLAWQRWLFGVGMFFTALAFSAEISTRQGVSSFRFLIQDYPLQVGVCVLFGLICWVAYFSIRRRVRM